MKKQSDLVEKALMKRIFSHDSQGTSPIVSSKRILYEPLIFLMDESWYPAEHTDSNNFYTSILSLVVKSRVMVSKECTSVGNKCKTE